MSINISEENPTQSSGGADKAQKQAKQLAYDVRYKVRQKMGGKKTDAASLKRAYLQQLAQSPSPGPVKRLAKKMLIGEQYDFVDIDLNLDNARSNVIRKVFVEKNIEEYEEEIIEGKTEKKYQIRVTDKKSGKVYTRMADRSKIGELRKSGNVSSVEMTGYGYDKTKKKAKAKKDFDGDGKVESPKAEYKGSKDKAIKKALAKEGVELDESDIADILARLEKKRISKGGNPDESPLGKKTGQAMKAKQDAARKKAGVKTEGYQRDPEKLKKDKTHSKQPDPSKDGFTGIGNMSIKDIMKMNKKMKKEEVETIEEAERKLADRLARKRKLYDKTTKKAMQFARDEGEASGHARYRMSSISREMDGIKAKMNKEHHQVDANGKVIEHGDGTPSSVEEDYYKGTGEKVVARTREWMKKKGQKGAPGLDAMKAREAEHKAKRGVKTEEFMGEVVDKTVVPDGEKKIDVMKGKNKIKINPNVGEQVEVEKEDPSIEKKQQRVSMMKRQILQKKMQAVRSGAGADIVAHTEQEGDMVEGAKRPSELKSRAKLEALLKRKEDLKKKQKVAEGIGDAVKKGVKRHKDAVEKKKIKNRKAVPYAALAAEHQPEGEVVEAVGCETKKVENKGKKKVDPEKNPVVEAKVDKGRSDYGKATIRNWRHSGPDTVEPAMFDPENKRGKTIEKRRAEHKARRGVKTKSVKEGVIREEDKAFNYVLAKLKKKHGSGVLTKGDKIKPQSAADKAKARAHQAKVDAENAAERKKDPSQGRYPKGYSNRGSD